MLRLARFVSSLILAAASLACAPSVSAVVSVEAPPGAENIRSERTCLVVFAVAEGDKEEGRLGLVVTRFGWSQLFELGYSDAKLLELQRSAHGGTNAELFPDGSLE